MDPELELTKLCGVTAAIEYASDLLRDAATELRETLKWDPERPQPDDVQVLVSALFAVRTESDALQSLIATAMTQAVQA